MPVRDKAGRFLLDQEEGNLGNFLDNVNALPRPETGRGPERRVLDFNGNSKYGAVLTIAMATYLREIVAEAIGGPIVGIVEFGNGGVFTRLEFDVPYGSAPLATTKNLNTEDGVILSVPASAVRVIARNDGALIPLDAVGVPVGTARLDGLTDSDQPSPMVVKAHIVGGTRASFGRVKRLFPLSSFAVLSTFDRTYNIPPFAKTVRFLRDTIGAPINYEFLAGFAVSSILDAGFVGPGVSSPIFDVPSQANLLRVIVGAPGVFRSYADYEIGV